MTPSPIFTGTSRYSSDFQNVINRSLAIASLPLQQYNNNVSKLTGQQSALQGLSDKLKTLQAAVDSLNQATGSGSYAATTSDSGTLSAVLGPGAMTGTYTLHVDSLGACTSAISADGLTKVTDPASQSVSASAAFSLTVNGTSYNLTPASQSLTALADAINGSGAAVEASIVNIGSTSSPDYRLAVQGTRLAQDQIQLTDANGGPLLGKLVPGSPAQYEVNGLSTPTLSDSRTVTLAPGLTVDLLAPSASTQPTTITVARASGGIHDALQTFVTAYNAVVDALAQQHGSNAGALSGDPVLAQFNAMLRQITSASGGGSIQSLSGLGLDLDQYGKLSLNDSVFAGLKVSDISTFLGSETGSGLLNAATNVLNSLNDPVSGILQEELTGVQNSIKTQQDRISQTQDQVNQLQTRLQAQMSAADALIASMEQQYNLLAGMFQTMTGYNGSTGSRQA